MSKLKSNVDLGMLIEWCYSRDNQKVLNNLSHFTIQELNTPYNGGTTLLQSAAENGNDVIVRSLIDLGVDLNVADEDFNQTALHSAAWTGGSLQIIQMLIDAGADISLLDTMGRTALHYAASAGAPVEVLQLLIDSGIKINIKDIENKTALDAAIENDGSVDVIHFLQTQVRMLPVTKEMETLSEDNTNLTCNHEKKSTFKACVDGATSASTLVFAEVSASVSFYSGGNDYSAAIAGGGAVVSGCIASIIDNANSTPCEGNQDLLGRSNDD